MKEKLSKKEYDNTLEIGQWIYMMLHYPPILIMEIGAVILLFSRFQKYEEFLLGLICFLVAYPFKKMINNRINTIKANNPHIASAQRFDDLYKKIEIAVENKKFNLKNYTSSHKDLKYSIFFDLNNTILSIEYNQQSTEIYKMILFDKQKQVSSDVTHLYFNESFIEKITKLIQSIQLKTKNNGTLTDEECLELLNKSGHLTNQTKKR